MKKKLLVGILIAVLVIVVGGLIYLFRPRPVRIALVNYSESMWKGMMRAVDRKNVSLHIVKSTEELAAYDGVIAFGMGLKWTEEDRERVRALDTKGIRYMTIMVTTPENDLTNIDSTQRTAFLKYFRNAGHQTSVGVSTISDLKS